MFSLLGNELNQGRVINFFLCAFAARHKEKIKWRAICKGDVRIYGHSLVTDHGAGIFGNHEAFLRSLSKFAPERNYFPGADKVQTCWAGFVAAAAMFHEPLQKELGFPEGRKCAYAMMFGNPQYKVYGIPRRKPLEVTWK